MNPNRNHCKPPLVDPLASIIMLAGLFMLVIQSCQAEKPVFAPYFSSNMVLQRGRDVRVWGQAVPRRLIHVEFAGDKVKGSANIDGVWSVVFEKLEESAKPQMLTAYDGADREKSLVQLTNVLVGDILVVGIPRGLGIQTKSDILSNASHVIRFLELPQMVGESTLRQAAPSQWMLPGSAELAALAAYAGLEYAADPMLKGVPVGIVATDLSRFNAIVAQSATPLRPFATKAWNAARKQYEAGKQLENQEFLRLKREGKRATLDPLKPYLPLNHHLFEAFPPKLPPASVFRFKEALNSGY